MALGATFLHTSPVHVARFDALRDRIAPTAQLHHITRPDWLDRARAHGITPVLQSEIADQINASDPPVLCTCSTIAPAAVAAGALSIDGPVMAAAAAIGGRICLAYVLESTARPSHDALNAALVRAGTQAQVDVLPMPGAWPLFEAGDMAGYAAALSDGVRDYLRGSPDCQVVVLAQASMDVALPVLADCGTLVLAAPELAFRALLTL